ncbi:MAG: hypothetical protein QG637_409, partial [Chloroflexota bacterium]|nr:hypothetical protein [Chloroflexota bacterium]
TANVTLVGTGVAPVNAVASGNTLVRIGTTGIASVSITNVGDGNKSGLPASVSNLNGTYTQTLGAGFTAAAPSAISLADGGSTTIGFSYNATTRTTSSSSATISFANGKSDGSNASQTLTANAVATGVGPTYASSFAGSNVTPVANNPTGSNLSFGTVDVGYWQSFYLTLANITTDSNGGNDALTDLTIESFNFTGANAANFKVASGTGIIHKGSSILVPIQVFSTTNTALVSTLTILTDQSAALGGIGDTFTYQLTAVAAPEPATLAVVGAGLAALAYARRKRRQTADT